MSPSQGERRGFESHRPLLQDSLEDVQNSLKQLKYRGTMEIETMLNLGEDIEKTGYYQSVLKKTKLKVVPKLLEKGLSIQEIAESLELDVEEVRKVAEEL